MRAGSFPEISLPGGVLYELAGPVCAKTALFLSGSIAKKEAAIPEEQEAAPGPAGNG